MKTNAFLVIFTFVFFAFYSCDPKPTSDTGEPEVNLPVGITKKSTANRITDSTAIDWVTRWNQNVNQGGGYLQRFPLYAFDLPHNDVNNLMNESGAASFRLYLGMNSSNEYKAALVGVDGQKKDMTDTLKNYYTFDLSIPCPSLCDSSSVLYTGPKATGVTPPNPMGNDTITLTTANDWVTRWNETVNINNGGYLNQFPLYAFDLPFADISNIFNEIGAKTFRVYLGQNSTPEYKAALVGVDSLGFDMIDPNGNLYVFDLSIPCPSLCDSSSILFNQRGTNLSSLIKLSSNE